MRYLSVVLTVICIAASIHSCKKSSSAPANMATVMFVNGCAGTSNVNVTVNSKAVGAATNLAFLGNSGYQYISAGTDSVAFILSATGTPLDISMASFTLNNHYTVFLGGLVNHTTFAVLSDDLTAPASGNARVRFVNLSNDSMSASAYVGTISIASGIGPHSYTSFVDVPGGSYVLKAGDPSNISTVVSTAAQNIAAGKIYTIMLTGTLTGSGTSGLTITSISNN